MTPRRSEQEWQTLIQQCEESTLSTKEFCRQNQLTTSTFYAKRKHMNVDEPQQSGGFIRAKTTERVAQYQEPSAPVAHMTLTINDVELSLPQGTPAVYLAELIRALQV
ncbi:IS66 family insertion sequence element accessory protein TnpB [Vibrio splendidus]